MNDEKKLTLLSLEKRVRALENAKGEVDAPQQAYDLGKIKHCHLCNLDMPQMIEELHAHVKHGL